MQNGAFHAGHELDNAGIAYVLYQPIDNVVTKLAMGHLAAAEPQACLYLVAFREEADGLVLLGLVIVLIHGHREFHFLDGDDLLLFARGSLALFLFVKVAAVVLDPADGGHGVGRNFDQIETPIARDSQGFKGGQNAKLFAVFIDDADFARADALIDADKGLGRTFVECDGAPPKMIRAASRFIGPPRVCGR